MIERCQAAFLQAAALAAGFGDQCDSHLRHYPFHRRTGFWRSAADGQSVVRGFPDCLFPPYVYFARSIGWRTILGRRVDLKTCFFGISEGYFLNNLFPLRAGELGRALFVGRASGLGMMHILSTILIERAFDIFFAAGILLITLPLVVGAAWIKPVAFTAFVIVIAGLAFLFSSPSIAKNSRTGFIAETSAQVL